MAGEGEGEGRPQILRRRRHKVGMKCADDFWLPREKGEVLFLEYVFAKWQQVWAPHGKRGRG